jgi:alpha-N-arabinofuranosidase
MCSRRLKELHVPVLRWPGGCFADEYHWRDGIGPRDKRPRRSNSSWGGVDTNAFGTHEFMDLCEMLGADAYVNGNVGSGSPQEMMEWIEYMTADADSELANLRRRNGRDKPWKVPYFAIGNETWGCGGNMRPEYYADVYRRYATFIKNHSGNRIQKLAVGGYDENYNWTEVLMAQAGSRWTDCLCTITRCRLVNGTRRARRRSLEKMSGTRRSSGPFVWMSSFRDTARSWTSTIHRSALA